MACGKILPILVVSFAFTNAQISYNDFYREKPGSCSPPLPIGICSRTCYADGHCEGNDKCCPTNCGGTVCSRPVTTRRQETLEKPGSCPAVSTARWICSSTCTSDSDCRGTKKCCKNRCGAFACQTPDIEVIESIEIPFNNQPGVSYNNVPNNIPNNVYNNVPNNIPNNVYNNLPNNIPNIVYNNEASIPNSVYENDAANIPNSVYNNVPNNYPNNPFLVYNN